jgi:Flp pilus assembly protein TadG
MRAKARRDGHERAGQAMVEFAIVSTVFLMIVLGCVDFGRSIFMYAQLNNAVRDSAREGKVALSSGFGLNTGDLARRVRIEKNRETSVEHKRPGLSAANATVSCSGGCKSGDKLTVSATLPFTAVSQGMLNLPPITLRASSTVVLE